ncbi:MAG: hypothetical protein J6Y78_17860 [Paludibacteraceae bacterium]|nr:hypothetical protein [Paludibacteraceae bacterium]
MEIIVVSDTNIFIDLIEIELLDEFFSLPWEIHTTDMVVYELKDAIQRNNVLKYISEGSLLMDACDEKAMLALMKFYALHRETTNVSIQDCSVWFYAKNNGCILLTGDSKLRSAALKTGVDVHGILFIIDNLIDKHLLAKETAVNKLNKLKLLNPRLPLSEIDKRIKIWREDEKEGDRK